MNWSYLLQVLGGCRVDGIDFESPAAMKKRKEKEEKQADEFDTRNQVVTYSIILLYMKLII